MKRDGLLGLIGGLLLAAGLMVGLIPSHSSSGESCGSPFASEAGVSSEQCEPKLNSNRPVAILLTAVGAVGLSAAFVSLSVAGQQDPSTADASADD